MSRWRDGVLPMVKRVELEIPLVELVRDIPWFTVNGKKYEPGKSRVD
jgi:hypothetical protein